jgi:excisionase family DNA binding protein
MATKSANSNKTAKIEYTIGEVAKILKVTRETVRRYVRSNRLGAVRKSVKGLKKEYRITQDALNVFRASLNQEDVGS